MHSAKKQKSFFPADQEASKGFSFSFSFFIMVLSTAILFAKYNTY